MQLRPVVIVNEILRIFLSAHPTDEHTQASYIFDFLSGFRGALNLVFTFASIRRHFS